MDRKEEPYVEGNGKKNGLRERSENVLEGGGEDAGTEEEGLGGEHQE